MHQLLRSVTVATVAATAAFTLSVPAPASAFFVQPNTTTRHAFTLNPGGKFIFSLPAMEKPIFILISARATSGGTQTPTEVFYAVLNQDPVSGQLTWIGTNSDGSATAGTTLSGFNICNLWAGGAPSAAATLSVNGAMTSNQLEVSQSNSTTGVPYHYIVTMFS